MTRASEETDVPVSPVPASSSRMLVRNIRTNRTVAASHAEYIQVRKLCPDALLVNTTPQMTCFRGAKVCTKWLQGKVMKNCYRMTTS